MPPPLPPTAPQNTPQPERLAASKQHRAARRKRRAFELVEEEVFRFIMAGGKRGANRSRS